jgi:hypothetical protein
LFVGELQTHRLPSFVDLIAFTNERNFQST